jgi:hypothetical protein
MSKSLVQVLTPLVLGWRETELRRPQFILVNPAPSGFLEVRWNGA